MNEETLIAALFGGIVGVLAGFVFQAFQEHSSRRRRLSQVAHVIRAELVRNMVVVHSLIEGHASAFPTREIGFRRQFYDQFVLELAADIDDRFLDLLTRLYADHESTHYYLMSSFGSGWPTQSSI